VDDALRFIHQTDRPWLVQVAFHAPHLPLPPTDLIGDTDLDGSDGDIEQRPEAYHRAMIQAMDTELGRLLDGIGPQALGRTWVIWLADNGTTEDLDKGAWQQGHNKGRLYEGGINVPLVIAGPQVDQPGRHAAQLVHVLDVFPTVLDLVAPGWQASLSADTPLDGVRLAPLLRDAQAGPVHDWLMSEQFGSRLSERGTGRAIRDARYKLIVRGDGDAQLYDLQADPTKEQDLLARQQGVQVRAAHPSIARLLAAIPAPDVQTGRVDEGVDEDEGEDEDEGVGVGETEGETEGEQRAAQPPASERSASKGSASCWTMLSMLASPKVIFLKKDRLWGTNTKRGCRDHRRCSATSSWRAWATDSSRTGLLLSMTSMPPSAALSKKITAS